MDGVSWIVIDRGRHFDTKAVYTYSLTNSQESFVSNELKKNIKFYETVGLVMVYCEILRRITVRQDHVICL